MTNAFRDAGLICVTELKPKLLKGLKEGLL